MTRSLRGAWAIAVLASGCGGEQAAPGPIEAPAEPVNENAPGWATKGDKEDDQGHRFICEGAGASEEDAMAAARAICDDKICKLCGVEVESLVETTETLTGVEMQRKVVERCRRVRQGETDVQRKSTDCGPNGCFAWVQIDYSNEKRQTECKRLTDENFADPAACQNLIEEFKSTEGFTAESFRVRVDILERATIACAEIDVRPTPLMQSLDEKLKVGMTTFRRGAPRHLQNYWLADYSPMWTRFKESPKFIERLDILLGYLRHKIPLLDVLEAVYIDDMDLDTSEAIANLLEKMQAAPKEEAYGVANVHMVAVGHLHRQADRDRLLTDLGDLNAWIRSFYSPVDMRDWGHVVAMYGLFSADKTIDPDEWEWATRMTTWRNRCLQELLEVESHAGESRRARFNAALKLALAQDEYTEKRFKAFEAVLPHKAPGFLLDIEADLPTDIQNGLTFAFLNDYLPGWDAWETWNERLRLVERMRKAIADTRVDALDEKSADRFCGRFYQSLDRLEEYGVSAQKLERQVCGCLEGPLADDMSTNSGNKSPLYERALAEGMRCVQPLR